MPESTKHREAFEEYWRLGRDALDRGAARGAGRRGTGTVAANAVRVVAYLPLAGTPRRIERRARESEDEARVNVAREAAERHAKEAVLLQQKGTEWLVSVSADAVTAEAAIRAISEGIRLERLVRGEPTTRAEVNTTTGLERLSNEQLAELEQLLGSPLDGAAEAQPG